MIERLSTLPQRHEALALGLCGSLARGDAGPRSDADVFVLVPDGSDVDVDRRWWDLVAGALEPVPVSVLVYTPSAILGIANWYVLRLASDAVLVHDPEGRAADAFRRVIEAAQRAGFEQVLVEGRSVWRRRGPGALVPFELRADA